MEQAVVEGTRGRRCVVGLWGRFWNREQRLWKEVVGDGWGRRTDVTRSVSSPGQGRGLGGRGVQDESRTECHGGVGGTVGCQVTGRLRPSDAARWSVRRSLGGSAVGLGFCSQGDPFPFQLTPR